jgi:hypothetical protein
VTEDQNKNQGGAAKQRKLIVYLSIALGALAALIVIITMLTGKQQQNFSAADYTVIDSFKYTGSENCDATVAWEKNKKSGDELLVVLIDTNADEAPLAANMAELAKDPFSNGVAGLIRFNDGNSSQTFTYPQASGATSIDDVISQYSSDELTDKQSSSLLAFNIKFQKLLKDNKIANTLPDSSAAASGSSAAATSAAAADSSASAATAASSAASAATEASAAASSASAN